MIKVIVVISIIGVQFYLVFRNDKPKSKYKKIFWVLKNSIKFNKYDKAFLLENQQYYAALSDTLKKKFEQRLIMILAKKDFYYTRTSNRNKEKMLLLIAAELVQITFGLKYFTIDHFARIEIYKESFYLYNSDIRLSGYTSGSRGFIALSESAYLKSIEDRNDGFNVALHEFAHAIHISGIVDKMYFDDLHQLAWEKYAEKVIASYDCNQTNYLPWYAYKDKDELYACSIEQFFERPLQLQQHLPEAYELLKVLLNQNPIEKASPIEV
ncbi:MAG: zinc-dependent peptidase [Chitinophagales bacterium]|nr:zinc-dependent peptidase [Chitinophagales bacterium]